MKDISRSNSIPNKKFLIVEDNPLFQDVLQQALIAVEPNCFVHLCGDGAETEKLLNDPNITIDLALIDLGLPDISGISVIQTLRARFPDLAIMVISVISSDEMVLSAIRAGAQGYITKSQSGLSIGQSIREVLEGNFPISPSLARALFRLAGSPQIVDQKSFGLTERELETLKLLARGRNYSQVAADMGISLSTVQFNIRNLYRKLEVHSQAQAIAKAHRLGLAVDQSK